MVRGATSGGDRWRAAPIGKEGEARCNTRIEGTAPIGEEEGGCTGEGAERCPTPERARERR